MVKLKLAFAKYDMSHKNIDLVENYYKQITDHRSRAENIISEIHLFIYMFTIHKISILSQF